MHKRILQVTFLLLISCSGAFAQITLSPYSRYGLGDLFAPNSTRNFAMGGLGIANFDGGTVNRVNPASYADLRMATLDFSGFGLYTMQKSNANTFNSGTAGVQNIAFGFSNRKGWGVAFGLAPYSSVGYDVFTTEQIDVDGDIKTQSLRYRADGGLNQFYMGAGFRFLKKLYAGANMTIAFGSTSFQSSSSINDAAFQTVNYNKQVSLSGILPQFGLQYGDTLRLVRTISRMEDVNDRKKDLQGDIDNIDGLMARVAKKEAATAEWEAKQMKDADELAAEKDQLDAQVEQLMSDETTNAKEISSLQEKGYRLENKRQKILREIKARKREDREERNFLQSQRNRLTKRMDLLDQEVLDIEAGKKDSTVQKRSNYLIRVGAIFEPGTGLNGTQLITYDNTFVLDTLSESEGKVNVPMKYGLGLSFGRPGKWLVGGEVSLQDWSTFDYFGETHDLRSAMELRLGGEWIPEKLDRKFAKRVAYRAGVYYRQTLLTVDSEAIDEYGVTIGFGLPIGRYNPVGRMFSRLNIGVGLSHRGTLNANLLEDNTIDFRLGVNLNDIWFIRRRID